MLRVKVTRLAHSQFIKWANRALYNLRLNQNQTQLFYIRAFLLTYVFSKFGVPFKKKKRNLNYFKKQKHSLYVISTLFKDLPEDC